MRVEVRPLPEKKWHGKKGKESIAQPKVVEVLYDHETGKYATGLTEEEITSYGKTLGVSLSDIFVPGEAHPYFSEKASWIYLPNHTVIFDTKRPLDYVRVKFLKASKKVANSMKEFEEGKWPDATHVIWDEEEEVTLKASKIQLKMKASAAIFKMSLEEKAMIIEILSETTVKKRSQDYVDVEMDKLLEEKPEQILQTIDLGKEEVTIRAQVLELLHKNILTKEGNAIYYMGDRIALDYEDSLKWFKDPNNQIMKVKLLEKLHK
jgi:hypothetical protein